MHTVIGVVLLPIPYALCLMETESVKQPLQRCVRCNITKPISKSCKTRKFGKWFILNLIFQSMDMEEGDTIEVFTMQTGGDDLTNINGEDHKNCFHSIEFKPRSYDFRISKSHMQQIQSKPSLLKRKKVEIWYPS